MFTAIINGIFKVVLTLIQVIALPFNALVNNAFPSLANIISQIVEGIQIIFNGISNFVYILPTPLITALIFIFGIEITLRTTGIVIWGVQKSLAILQKIKFW